MSINLLITLEEKIEYMISQYIEELHIIGLLEEVKECYKSREYNIKYDLYVINILFNENVMVNYNKMRILNKISNGYFVKEDQNELQKYHDDYVSKLNTKQKKKWIKRSLNFNIYDLIFTVAYIFVKTNKNFIKEQIELDSYKNLR